MSFHHRDPFDRLLIAQALADGLTIVTHDIAFSESGENHLVMNVLVRRSWTAFYPPSCPAEF
jgi:hypothetical protein